MERPLIASVAVESGLKKSLDYLVPDSAQQTIGLGHLVEVPVRGQLEVGVVVGLSNQSGFTGQLRPLHRLFETGISPDLLELARWVSRYYCCPLRRVLQVILPKALREERDSEGPLFVTRKRSLQELSAQASLLRSRYPARARVIDILLKVKTGILLSQLLEQAEASASPVETLAKEGWIEIQPLPDEADLSLHHYFPAKAKQLNPEQQQALSQIQASLEQRQSQVHLLFGVTGSGKTEVYLRAMESVLRTEGSCLLMVPEVALTPQTIDRIRARFQERVAVLHYRLSPKQRQREWEAIRQGHARLVVGARSSVFSPLQNLRLIIVDEEHESSYKSEESPHYHARDVAIERARRCGATVVLGSATPSLESYMRGCSGQYKMLKMEQRASHAQLPPVQLVDMLNEYQKSSGYALFSSTLVEQLKQTIDRGEQALLFLNRRGYFAQTQCHSCGQALTCPHCDLNLTYHKSQLKLVCHLCHHHSAVPTQCPHCHLPGSFKFRGWGTEHVQGSLQRLLPNARVLRIDADTTRHKGSLEKMLREFRTHKADILVGTQMVAKGHHFPGLTLVGVLNPDAQLLQPDFRAGEQLFQLLVQVFGRSGRSHLPGQVLIQTSQPQATIYRLAAEHNYVAFAEQELQMRKLFVYPPFIHLIKVTVSGPREEEVITRAHSLHQELMAQLPSSCMISSPGEGAWRKIQDSWRQVFLIKTRQPLQIGEILETARRKHEKAQVRVSYDIDCQHIG